MFEVLAFVYDSYCSHALCPTLPALHRKLNALGFRSDGVLNALVWLEELQNAAHSPPHQIHMNANVAGGTSAEPLGVWAAERPTPVTDGPAQRAGDTAQRTLPPGLLASSRVLTDAEHRKIGTEGWGLLTKLASAGSLPWNQMELVLDRAMATPGHTLDLDQLKLIVLMVFWSLDQPTEMVLNENLFDNCTAHAVH